MAGPSQHGQHNKAHKAGRKAGQSARQKHADKKGGGHVNPMHGGNRAAASRAERINAAKVIRDRKRSEVLSQKRETSAPRVVAFLPLSQAVQGAGVWKMFLNACQKQTGEAAGKAAAQDSMDTGGTDWPLVPTTVSLAPRHKTQLTLLPPPGDVSDPLAIVELARSAETLVLLVPSPQQGLVDDIGFAALAMLRAMGLPSLVALVPEAPLSLQAKAAAKKHATAQLAAEVAGLDKVYTADAPDLAQLLRHLGEQHGGVPQWRRSRSSLMVQAIEYVPAAVGAQQEGSNSGKLLLSGYVRNMGLSANQLLHIPAVGDFQMDQIDSAPVPSPAVGPSPTHQPRDTAGAEAMDASGGEFSALVVADPERRESLQRENIPDPLAGEQTWPTAEELADAERAAQGDLPAAQLRLPKGTSEYQAAWILDEEVGAGSDSEVEPEPAGQPPSVAASQGGARLSAMDSEQAAFLDDDSTATEADGLMDEDESEAGLSAYEQQKEQRRREQDALQFPDEVDTPTGIRASVRFAKYRGLKSWRTSPWDPREELPREYARVFAFENFRRAHKRAHAAAEAATSPTSPDGVPPGTYVRLHVANVPEAMAQALLSRHQAAFQEGGGPPVVATGLLQHEAKLSVLNFGVRKAASYGKALPNKAELLFVTGVRSWMAQPIFTADDPHADKHKMERFLHDGHNGIASVYAPVSYPPGPLLAFDVSSGTPQLAMTGTLRSVDPDRINLKKIVLTGFPVKVHKNKAVVRWMFHTPEDVLWFRPLDLWTKYGRRGRIKESMGTHGAMKCLFDGPVQQRDSVCVSLFKRVYPKWPQDLNFAA